MWLSDCMWRGVGRCLCGVTACGHLRGGNRDMLKWVGSCHQLSRCNGGHLRGGNRDMLKGVGSCHQLSRCKGGCRRLRRVRWVWWVWWSDCMRRGVGRCLCRVTACGHLRGGNRDMLKGVGSRHQMFRCSKDGRPEEWWSYWMRCGVGRCLCGFTACGHLCGGNHDMVKGVGSRHQLFRC